MKETIKDRINIQISDQVLLYRKNKEVRLDVIFQDSGLNINSSILKKLITLLKTQVGKFSINVEK